MPTFGREKNSISSGKDQSVFALWWALFHIWAKLPAGASSQAAHGPSLRCSRPNAMFHATANISLQPGWQGSKGCRLLNCRYFLPLRNTLCWKLCFYKQSWGLCVCWCSWEDLWDTTLGILPLFIIMFRCCLGRAGCRCAQVIPALRGF